MLCINNNVTFVGLLTHVVHGITYHKWTFSHLISPTTLQNHHKMPLNHPVLPFHLRVMNHLTILTLITQCRLYPKKFHRCFYIPLPKKKKKLSTFFFKSIFIWSTKLIRCFTIPSPVLSHNNFTLQKKTNIVFNILTFPIREDICLL